MTAFESLMGITSSSNYEDIKMFQAVTERSLCHGIGSVKSYIKVQAHMTHNCTLPITIIAAGTAVGVVILILVVVCVVCNYRVRKAQEEANYLGECCFSQSFSTLQSNPQPPLASIPGLPSQPWDPVSSLQPWVVAVPEVKTYKETELNVSFEHTEPMNVSIRESFPLEPGQILDLQHRTQMRSSCPFNWVCNKSTSIYTLDTNVIFRSWILSGKILVKHPRYEMKCISILNLQLGV